MFGRAALFVVVVEEGGNGEGGGIRFLLGMPFGNYCVFFSNVNHLATTDTHDEAMTNPHTSALN